MTQRVWRGAGEAWRAHPYAAEGLTECAEVEGQAGQVGDYSPELAGLGDIRERELRRLPAQSVGPSPGADRGKGRGVCSE